MAGSVLKTEQVFYKYLFASLEKTGRKEIIFPKEVLFPAVNAVSFP